MFVFKYFLEYEYFELRCNHQNLHGIQRDNKFTVEMFIFITIDIVEHLLLLELN